MTRKFIRSAVLTALLGCTCLSSAVWAQAPAAGSTTTTSITIPAQDLSGALLALGRQTGRSVTFLTDVVAGKRSVQVQAAPSFEAALQQMLAGTGLHFVIAPDGSASVVQRTSAAAPPTVSMREARRAEEPPEEIVVTGSRIRGRSPVGSQVIQLERTDIEQQGFASVQDAVRSLPQNISVGPSESLSAQRQPVNSQNSRFNYGGGTGVNLRGLGADSTLTLINGRRIASTGYGAFVDISQIPLSAVDRIEILTDGASALYGSDAVGGVVNVILRRNYEGAETKLRYGVKDGATERSASQLFGLNWDGGNLLVDYGYRHKDRLAQADRPYARDDLRAFGGSDFRVTTANPGNIIVNGQSYAIPRGQDGRNLPPSMLVAGTRNLDDINAAADILPRLTQHSAGVRVEQRLDERVRTFADARFSYRKSIMRSMAQYATLTVPNTNAFFVSPVPGARSINVEYSFLHDLGPGTFASIDRSWITNAGAEVELPFGWRAELVGSYTRDAINYQGVNLINNAALATALASSDPATAFNPFGDGSNTNRDVLTRINGRSKLFNSFVVRTANVKADGPLFDLGAGPMRAAIGAEWRQERFHYQSSLQTATPTFVARPPSNISRIVRAVYGELLLPVFGPDAVSPKKSRFALSVAVRAETYSDFGQTVNPHVGAEFNVTRDLSLRTSYGPSFKAPALPQFGANTTISVFPLADPKSPSGQTQAILLQGGNRNLKPETATVWTTGATYKPAFVPGLELSASYFRIDYDNKVDTVDWTTALAREAENGGLVVRSPSAAFVRALMNDPGYTGGSIDPSQIGAYADLRWNNMSKLRVRGLDGSINYRIPLGEGELTAGVSGTYFITYESRLTATAAPIERAGTVSYPARFRGRANLVWSNAQLSVGAYVNYSAPSTYTGTIPWSHVGSFTTADFSIGYAPSSQRAGSLLDGIEIIASLSNAFDRRPPFVNIASTGYDAVNGDPSGRAFSLTITKKW